MTSMQKVGFCSTWSSSPLVEGLIVFVIVLVCLASGIGHSPIFNGDEARFSQASREMLLHKEWTVPTFAGEPRYDKPILIYWATATMYRIVGTTPSAARLTSVIAASLSAALLAWTARRRWGPGAGLAAGLLLAASPIFFFEGRTCTADALNLLWTLLAILAVEELVIGRQSRAAAAVFWLSIALAILTKGPVGPLFVGSTLLALLLFRLPWTRLQAFVASVLVLGTSMTVGPAILLIPVTIVLIWTLAKPSRRSGSRLQPDWQGQDGGPSPAPSQGVVADAEGNQRLTGATASLRHTPPARSTTTHTAMNVMVWSRPTVVRLARRPVAARQACSD